jgi:hypothetical protein
MISLVFVNSIRDYPTLQQAIEGIGGWAAVLGTGLARGVVTGRRHCPSVPKPDGSLSLILFVESDPISNRFKL